MREGKKQREGREREKKRRRKEKRIERKWHPVKSKKIVRRTELNLFATLSEMKGDFDKIISFHLSFFSSSLLCSLHSFNAPPFYMTSSLLSLLPFCICSPVCCFLFDNLITPDWVLLFIIKSVGVHKKTIEEKLTFYLTHQEVVN